MSIEIITEPKIQIVGRQMIDESALNDFLRDEEVEEWTTDTDIVSQKLVEISGRLCYKSYAKPRPGGNSAYLDHILEVGHGSVIEHATWNFIVTGVSRSFTHELVRHRAGMAYSQRSQRFCDETDASMVMPPFIAECRRRISTGHSWGVDQDADDARELDKDIVGEWLDSVRAAQSAYEKLSALCASRIVLAERKSGQKPDSTARRKKAREAARSVLPNATETQIFVTANARALRNVLEQRGDKSADAEIRRFAVKLCRIMQAEAPNLFGDFEVVVDEAGGGGSEYLTCKYRKV